MINQTSSPQSATLSLLLSISGGQVRIQFAKAAAALGYATQTARNRLCADKFPVASYKDGGRRFVDIFELAKYLDGLRETAALSAPRRRRGRPTKREQIARRLAEEKLVGAGGKK